MQKIILPLALLLGTGTVARAQSGIQFGLKAGANLSGYTGSDNTDTKAKVGLNAGFTANFALSDLISIQPEVLFSQKGTQLDYNQDNSDLPVFINSGNTYGPIGSGTYSQTLSYLDVPVLVRVNLGGNNGTGFFVEVGPQVSFLLAQRGEVSGDKATVVLGGPDRSKNSTTIRPTLHAFTVDNTTNDFNKAVFGYAVGLGYRLTSALSLNVRYTGDISRVYKEGEGTAAALKPYQGKSYSATFLNPTVRSSTFQLQVGYVFGSK
ncbi:porin family protein [Hymenobacter properus]|uniref:PorT family protein n=1 Tax=Hymenobacter properus TaxID=2791026 RepID=A0A931BHI7_9BACT|nr:porin family protein [Hymenobacter properus]MBF9142397.1 PorT family protein [Hymenobacter properus]MBR7721204.1 PorT family protein [Microvirga sp. SRT04]